MKNLKTSYVFITVLTLVVSITALSPLASAVIPDQWVCASDYDITIGDPYSGGIPETASNNDVYLIGQCEESWWNREYEIEFFFNNLHYKKLQVELFADAYATFKLYAYYELSNGDIIEDWLFNMNPGYGVHECFLNHNMELVKIRIYYITWNPNRIYVGVDLLKALWTQY